jgi:DNA-3-methyladenine glycosylase I
MSDKCRCTWAKPPDFYIRYHDEEWGVPTHDDRLHFEWLTLAIVQAGLSFRTVLFKRAAYHRVFADFDITRVALFEDAKIQQLCQDPSIIRNKNKIIAIVNNARAFLKLQVQFGSFDEYIWNFVENQPIINYWRMQHEIPTHTPLSDRITKELKQNGFKFMGSKLIYAYMQSAGLVNDHLVDCFRYEELVSQKRNLGK